MRAAPGRRAPCRFLCGPKVSRPATLADVEAFFRPPKGDDRRAPWDDDFSDRQLRARSLLDQIRPRRLSCRLDRSRRSPCFRVPYAPYAFSYSAPPCLRSARRRRTGGMYGAPQALHASDHGSRRDGAARTGPAPQRSAIGPFRRHGTMIPKPARLPAPRNTRGATRLRSSKWGRDASQAKSTAALEARGSAINGSCRHITVGEPR